MWATLLKILIALLPLSLTVLWLYLIAGGYLNFGGGEKDLFLLIPWLFWSLVYLIIFVVLWLKHKTMMSSIGYAMLGATLVLTGLIVYLTLASGLV